MPAGKRATPAARSRTQCRHASRCAIVITILILSYGLWYPLMRKYAVNQVVPYTLLIPALTVGVSYLILGDRLDWQSVLGGVTTIVGVAVIVLRRVAPARPSGAG